ncbi:NAD(P)H-dependent oxidoreductase [candidate division KSB1 bacterium]|nr:NAD(P)H-dependent oxidoreductase [candidate division KSB1 bacterium]
MKSEILLLSGSYRGNNTTSNSILKYLSQHIENENYVISHLKLSSHVPDTKNDEAIFNHINKADLIVMCSPKYNLSLPAPVMYLFEMLYQRKSELVPKTRKFISILQFEAPVGGSTAQKICHNFSDNMGFHWYGSLTLPGAGEINGKPLEESGNMMKNIRKAIILTAKAISNDQPVPEKARKIGAKQMPTWLIILIVNQLIKQFCRKNNIDILKAPYLNEQGLWT